MQKLSELVKYHNTDLQLWSGMFLPPVLDAPIESAYQFIDLLFRDLRFLHVQNRTVDSLEPCMDLEPRPPQVPVPNLLRPVGGTDLTAERKHN